MKLTWNKKNSQTCKRRPFAAISRFPNLPFDQQDDGGTDNVGTGSGVKEGEAPNNQEKALDSTRDAAPDSDFDRERLARSFQAQGDKLAEEGKYQEALGKWESALTLTPGNAALHEQKAQVLLELGDAWRALKAATRATELNPSWAEAWLTLGRAQLNFGEPDSAVQSFDRALAIKPEWEEAQDDRRTASNLVKRRKHLHSSGLSTEETRFVVGDKANTS
ncbi:hypothetical protein SAY86_000124 [Trapa natans]|uniref:Tetratricopeptide repeat protein 33 n=1 Tax=Trapa natans TaxID=22666 RepID=A0AAN7MWZ9_TRANT|nr:hypothetical protein SAY86_000124 [Trapa natans]